MFSCNEPRAKRLQGAQSPNHAVCKSWGGAHGAKTSLPLDGEEVANINGIKKKENITSITQFAYSINSKAELRYFLNHFFILNLDLKKEKNLYGVVDAVKKKKLEKNKV